MSAPNWTPGDWTVVGDINDPGCYYIEEVDDHVSLIRDKGLGDPERAKAVTEANERLIGAAGYLYDALDELVRIVERVDPANAPGLTTWARRALTLATKDPKTHTRTSPRKLWERAGAAEVKP